MKISIVEIADKLYDIFEQKHQELFKNEADWYEFWLEYLDKHDIIALSKRELVDDFQDLFNERSLFTRDVVVIRDPVSDVEWTDFNFLLVPTDFAEKALVLGTLP